MRERRDPPIAGAYWLEEGAILAGEYPGAADEEAARERLARFLDAGIRTFVDLTEATEPLEPYAGLLGELAVERSVAVQHLRFAIRDASVPASAAQMQEILSVIRTEGAAGRPVYVHCWGGIGRTGTVAGCWLVERGLTGRDAIAHLAVLRAGTPDGRRPSPETAAQHAYILTSQGDTHV